MGIAPDDRRKRMVENVHVLRHLWAKDKDNEPFEGKFAKFANVTLEPKPVQNPCPIWLATNAERLSKGQSDFGGSEFALTRVGRIADGWMTHSVSPEGLGKSWDFILKAGRDHGRDMSGFDHVLYHHINVGDDKDATLADSKRFLDLYYGANYSKERLEAWLTYGTPEDCIAHLRRFKAAGCRRVTFRLSTMADPLVQLKRVTEDVLPFV
jgi:alkanesulfonate monooxygenase SsuD/methylene tetrahydromethanopterin reductase-like flavin-dependent oxidoreductase (luciferase family)